MCFLYCHESLDLPWQARLVAVYLKIYGVMYICVHDTYHQTSDISHTLVGNKIVDH